MAQKFMGNKKLFLDTKLISLKIFDQNYYLIDKIFEVKEKKLKKINLHVRLGRSPSP